MKRLIFILILLMSAFSVNSATAPDFNDAVVALTYDDTYLDGTPNNNDAINSGTSFSSDAIYNKSADFTPNDYIHIMDSTSLDFGTGNFWVSFWLEKDAHTTSGGLIGKRDVGIGTNLGFEIRQGTADNKDILVRLVTSSGIAINNEYNTDLSLLNWHHIVVSINRTNSSVALWKNGGLVDIVALTNAATIDNNVNMLHGVRNNSGTLQDYLNGRLDEINVFDGAANQDMVDYMYNAGAPGALQQYPYGVSAALVIDDINLVNNTFTNQSTLDVALNISALSTNTNINTTLNINNGTSIQIGTNTQNVSSSVPGFQEGVYNIYTNSFNNVTSVNSTNFTYTFDFTSPVITPIPDINTYTLNFTGYCTDTNLNICNLTLQNSSSYSDGSIIVFNQSGNKSYSILATDLAGNNVLLNSSFFIDPFFYVYFENSTSSPISNFTVNGTSYQNFFNGTIYTYGLGTHNFLFQKPGFSDTLFQLNFNLTSDINTTITITESKIIISIYDRETLELINTTTSITMQGTIGFNGTTDTGLLNITDINLLNEQYQIVADNDNYLTETVFFNFNNQEVLEIDIFMLDSNSTDAGVIRLTVTNSLSQFIEQATCSVLEWRPATSSFVSVAQGQTNVNGDTLMNIEIGTKIYEFSCNKDTFTTVTNPQIIQVDELQLFITLDDIELAPSPLFENLIGSLTNTTINATHQLVTFTFSDTDGLTTEGCLQLYYVNGNRETFINQTCTAASTGVLFSTLDINITQDQLIKATLSTSEVTDYVFDSIKFDGSGSIQLSLERWNLHILVPLLFAMIALVFGLAIGYLQVSIIGIMTSAWLSVEMAPSVFTLTIATVINVIGGFILWGMFKR